MIVKNKKDVAEYIASSPVVAETKVAYEEGDRGDFTEISEELVRVICRTSGRPKYGTDWGTWLDDNIDEMLQEAVSIVM